MSAESYTSDISHTVASQMTGFRHTHNCCLSMLRSSQETGKKQLRVWIEYAYSVAEVLLCSSFGAPLVLLWSPYGYSVMARSEFKEGSKLLAMDRVGLHYAKGQSNKKIENNR